LIVLNNREFTPVESSFTGPPLAEFHGVKKKISGLIANKKKCGRQKAGELDWAGKFYFSEVQIFHFV
jgi:hypothetical protein